MNSFTDAFFSILLSWVRSLTNAAWTAFRSGGQQGILSWLADHWLGLLILATLAGLTTDWIVWMLRWRPYRLWFSGLRRRSAPWQGNNGDESTPVYGEAYEDGALEAASADEAYPANAAYEEDPDALTEEADAYVASETTHAAYAPPARWKGSSMPPEPETPDENWAPESPAEEAREAYWPTQANAEWTEDAWADPDETPEDLLSEEAPAGAMPVEQAIAPEPPA
nr:hypothetical protein [Clostridia bacterium]